MTTKNPKITNEHHDHTYSPCASWEYDGAQGTMRYAMGHWCFHYGSAAQWVEDSGDDSALSAAQRAIRTGEMGRLLKVVRGVRWSNGAHGRREAAINGRVIARMAPEGRGYRVAMYWNPLSLPKVRMAVDMPAGERMVFDHAAQPDVADPYAYLDGLEPRDQRAPTPASLLSEVTAVDLAFKLLTHECYVTPKTGGSMEILRMRGTAGLCSGDGLLHGQRHASESDCAAHGDCAWHNPGYYIQACFPGCLPDGVLEGPFDTFGEAEVAAGDTLDTTNGENENV